MSVYKKILQRIYTMKKIFPGVYEVHRKLATKNSSPGYRVYGEKLFREGGVEYRQWDPFRSKLAAAIKNGLTNWPFKKDSTILYLGASSGTTPSHLSDTTSGFIYCIEYSKRMMRELVPVCQKKPNMIPLLGDANRPQQYLPLTSPVDIIYQDVAQPNQAEILLKNASYYKPDNALFLIKARSIDSSQNPKKIFRAEVEKLKPVFEVLEVVTLEPYEKDHILVNLRRR